MQITDLIRDLSLHPKYKKIDKYNSKEEKSRVATVTETEHKLGTARG